MAAAFKNMEKASNEHLEKGKKHTPDEIATSYKKEFGDMPMISEAHTREKDLDASL